MEYKKLQIPSYVEFLYCKLTLAICVYTYIYTYKIYLLKIYFSAAHFSSSVLLFHCITRSYYRIAIFCFPRSHSFGSIFRQKLLWHIFVITKVTIANVNHFRNLTSCFKHHFLKIHNYLPALNMSLGFCVRPLPSQSCDPWLWGKSPPSWRAAETSKVPVPDRKDIRRAVPVPLRPQEVGFTIAHWCTSRTRLKPELVPATPLEQENKPISSSLLQCSWVSFVLMSSYYPERRLQMFSWAATAAVI